MNSLANKPLPHSERHFYSIPKIVDGICVKVSSSSVNFYFYRLTPTPQQASNITGCLSPLASLRQDRQAVMPSARQANLSFRSRPRLSSVDPRNRSFSSASPDGQCQHMARMEHRAWAGDPSSTKSSTKVVRLRRDCGSSSFPDGFTLGSVAAAAAPRVVIPARLASRPPPHQPFLQQVFFYLQLVYNEAH